MFDHIGFDVKNLSVSKTFYEKALAPLGIQMRMHNSEWGVAGFGDTERPRFWIVSGEPTAGPDEIHVCFVARNRAMVQAFYDAAIAAGGRDHGKPGLRPQYHPNYFGAFVLDPDGHNVEACCHSPE